MRAVAAGKVVDARFDRPEQPAVENVNFVLPEHDVGNGKKVQSLYAHLKTEANAPVSKGQSVARGARLGRIGRSGTSADHLHFQLQDVPDPAKGDCGMTTTSRPKGDYPFCKSKAPKEVNPCGFVETLQPKSGFDYTSANAR